MTGYRRNFIQGGRYFFTVNLGLGRRWGNRHVRFRRKVMGFASLNPSYKLTGCPIRVPAKS
ncbi:MAG: hypothetical protein AB7F49_03500 [Pseudorhodoplanes sp.]